MHIGIFFVVATLFFSLVGQAVRNGLILEPTDFRALSTVMVLHNEFFETGSGQCSGALVAPNLVLTAAHCVVNLETGAAKDPNSLKVYFGSFDGKSFDQQMISSVSSLRVHADYSIHDSGGLVRDIALIRLSREAPTPFKPAVVLEDSSKLKYFMTLSLVAYGNFYFVGDPREGRSRILRVFDYSIINPRDRITGMISCENEHHGGMAGGDSGGPGFVMIDGVPHLVGVASGYRGGFPSFEHVPDNALWIRAMAQELQ